MSEQKKSVQYTTEFRQSAVKLAIESGQPISHTAKNLGVNENMLHSWISQYHAQGKAGTVAAANAPMHEELKRLRKENKRLQEEYEILKKAAAYFAKKNL